MTDVTMYSDGELSLQFLNDEGLYNMMRGYLRFGRPFDRFTEEVDQYFTYTPDQLSDLEDTYYEEGKEMNS